MHKSAVFKLMVLSPIICGVILSFQNCSPVAFRTGEDSSLVPNDTLSACKKDPSLAQCQTATLKCTFNGQEYSEGETVTAYLTSTVATGQTCTSEVRKCEGGAFTGTYLFATCAVNGPASCLFNGRTIASGASVTAFQNSSVPFGSTCSSQSRVCTNGSLSGSYNFETCTPGAAASCLFNGQTVAHGASVIAYPSSSVPFGSSCQGSSRTCNNGVLSGAGNYATCNTSGANSCLFNGQTVPHGGSVKAYQNSSVAYGQTCVSQDRICNNGDLNGSYAYASCTQGSAGSCLFNGQTYAHGQSVTAYQSSTVPYGQSCVSQQRTCNNGTMSGSYQYGSCNPNSAQACLFNGQTVAHGQSVTAYASSTVAYGQTCSSQSRTCNNGTLSGSYSYSSCNPGSAASCYLGGQTIAHGQSILAYLNAAPPAGQQCSSQYRTCTNGVLSGSYQNLSCTPQQAASCSFNGQTIPNGGSVTAYASSSVPYGQSCQAQTRQCVNGSLSGSYQYSTCSPQSAASCYYPGGTLTWGVNNACSVYAGAITVANGGTTSYNSLAAGGQGSVAFSCSNGNFQLISQTCTPVVTVISVTPYCDGNGCVMGCGMWERGDLIRYSDGTTRKTNVTTGGAYDCGAGGGE